MAVQSAGMGKPARSTFFRWTERRREYLAFLILIFPNLTQLAVWTYWPFINSIFISITDWNLLSPVHEIVGLNNYVALFQSPTFWQVMRNTVIFTVGSIFIRLGLSLALAVLLNQWLIARGFWRLIIFSPHITTTAAMALVWSAMYDPNHGPIAAVLKLFGIQFPNVLANIQWVLPALMLVAIWKALGFSTVIFLAALQGVDRELKDAAAVDGANMWQAFWHVSFPAISPVTYFLLITGLIDAFQTFDLVSVMTNGGPVNASNLYVYYLYRESFHYYRMGSASAIAVIFFTIVMTMTYVQNRFASRWVHY
ncbi:MAG: sugar ABC transporter permease [Caldilineaceae bacterium]|nr:sugar ABC transporter permease [Caldilineaceae bacterium]